MRTKLFAWGVVLAASITGAVWHIGASGGGIGKGHETTVELSGSSATMDTVDRIETVADVAEHDGSMSAFRDSQPNVARSRKVLGVWLLTMIGTSAALGLRKSRTV